LLLFDSYYLICFRITPSSFTEVIEGGGRSRKRKTINYDNERSIILHIGLFYQNDANDEDQKQHELTKMKRSIRQRASEVFYEMECAIYGVGEVEQMRANSKHSRTKDTQNQLSQLTCDKQNDVNAADDEEDDADGDDDDEEEEEDIMGEQDEEEEEEEEEEDDDSKDEDNGKSGARDGADSLAGSTLTETKGPKTARNDNKGKKGKKHKYKKMSLEIFRHKLDNDCFTKALLGT
jgi:hypothetical protein